MTSLDPNIAGYLERLRLIDPEQHLRLQQALRTHRDATIDAEFAFEVLQRASAAMAQDLVLFLSAQEHLEKALESDPLHGRRAESRRRAAFTFLARAMDPDADPDADPDEVLLRASLRDHRSGPEESHLEGIGSLRAAAKMARAASTPWV